MAVHQLIPSFVSGDATGQAALHFALLLRRLGHFGNIYAGEVEPGHSSLALSARALRPAADDLVLYHHGIASPLAGRVLHLPCKKGLVFHNVTPARYYEGTPLHEPLRSGRAQLAALAPNLDLAIGVSRFNARELEVAGAAAELTHVVPLFVEPERFTAASADPKRLSQLRGSGGPTIVSVSRIAPHKRFEDLLALHEELLRLDARSRLIVVGGFDAGSRYWRALSGRMKGTPGITFTGRVSHSELVAAYRSASVFVSMSEHEGFGVPLLEAMACDLPVLAFAAAAVPETLGGAGIAFTEKRFAFLAELVHELHRDRALTGKILRGQRRRLEELSAAKAQAALAKALSSVRRGRVKSRPARGTKPKVAFVVQRFGEDVTGGAEKHARDVAEKLLPHWNITVLTTCAKDHLTWANEFSPGEDRVAGLKVLRFPTRRAREMSSFNALSRSRFGRALDRMHEEHWIAEQGPLAPGLFEAIEAGAATFDGFVFFTYLYAPTAWGVPLVSDKAMVVPTVHDEPPLAFHAYADALEGPRVLLCNTPEEEALIARRFPNRARSRIVGVGVDPLPAKPSRFAKKFNLDRPYLLYVGRIEPGKGVDALLDHHRALRRSSRDAPELVLAGGLHMTLSGEGVRYVGRISEEEKWDALGGAQAVVVPSKYESLSLLALEGFAAGTPVVANGGSDVLVGQCERSGAGVCYTDAPSFIEAVNRVSAQRSELGRKGRAFAKKHSWDAVVGIYREELARIMKEKKR